MNQKDNINPTGKFRATMEARRGGKKIPFSKANLAVPPRKIAGSLKGCDKVVEDDNLVVNDGRSKIAHLLGGNEDTFINRIILGDGPKTGNLPTLQQSGLINEIEDVDGNKKGKYLIDSNTEVFYPARTGRFPTDPSVDWGSADGSVSIDSDDHSYLEDTSVNFFDLGVQTQDQITLDTDPDNPLILQIRQVIDKNTIEVYNPNNYETPSSETIQYRIDTSGTQLLISKLMRGNNFPESDFGVATIIHEAGLLFADGTLFNRVVFAAFDENAGLILQPDTSAHDELSIRFEILITL